MTNEMKNYKEFCSIQDDVVKLQNKVQTLCHDMLHDENFLVAAKFKCALMAAMCEMNEAMSGYKMF